MPLLAVNNIELCYETHGNPADPAILLIAGLGVQLIDWADHIVDPLVAAGNFVIRYDNRDIGLSTTFAGAPNDPQVVFDAVSAGEKPDVRYTIADMADDAAGLLDALGIEAAHLVGVSMGGMVAQITAIKHPTKVLSLTSIMSTTGEPEVGQPSAQAMAALLSEAPGYGREASIAHNMTNAAVWASPAHFDKDRLQSLFERAWDRVDGRQSLNAGRQFCAIVATPPRNEALALLDVPTLVVHGTADMLIDSSGGQRTANCVPGAELLLIDGMGHDTPEALSPPIISSILRLVATAST